MSAPKPSGKSGNVQIISPDYRLQRKLGGPAGDVLSPSAVQRAEAAMEMLRPRIEEEVTRLFHALESAIHSASPSPRDGIWNVAHELRGLSGTVQRSILGDAANIICLYLEGTPPDFRADKPLMLMLLEICKQAHKAGADSDPMVQILISDGTRAVTAQRRREGRSTV